MESEEYLEIVDSEGNVIGLAPRSKVHGNPAHMHRVVHVLVFDQGGRLLLQKRSVTKDVAPGRWDTSVGGHVSPGEALRDAAAREMREELGIDAEPAYLYSYVHTNPYETEQVHTFSAIHDGPFRFEEGEIDEVRFWGMDEIRAVMDAEVLSDNFKHEFRTFLASGPPR